MKFNVPFGTNYSINVPTELLPSEGYLTEDTPQSGERKIRELSDYELIDLRGFVNTYPSPFLRIIFYDIFANARQDTTTSSTKFPFSV